MTTTTVTMVFLNESLYGHLLTQADYVALGGKPLAKAFRNHHVQMVRAPNNDLLIVDDTNAELFRFVDDVRIDLQPEGWSLSTNQSDEVHDTLNTIIESTAYRYEKEEEDLEA